jgi:hypothetical protein
MRAHLHTLTLLFPYMTRTTTTMRTTLPWPSSLFSGEDSEVISRHVQLRTSCPHPPHSFACDGGGGASSVPPHRTMMVSCLCVVVTHLSSLLRPRFPCPCCPLCLRVAIAIALLPPSFSPSPSRRHPSLLALTLTLTLSPSSVGTVEQQHDVCNCMCCAIVPLVLSSPLFSSSSSLTM